MTSLLVNLKVISKITQLNLFRHAGEGRYPF
jgi:hypothetical protein